MIALTANTEITWEKLPDDFVLPDDPVDKIDRPLLAMALTDSLGVAGKLSETTLTPTNYAICATLDGKFVAKAPDLGIYSGNSRLPPRNRSQLYP